MSKDKEGSTALATVSQQYPALAGGGERARALQENLGGDKLGLSDLNRIKVPAAGGTAWAVQAPSGEDHVKAIEGIIVAIERRRAFWASAGVSQTPPDCYSSDCVTGIGRPGGVCDACPMNAFGSAKKPDGSPGRGKACKETRLLFLLRPGEILPDVVSVPPGSIRTLRPFLTRLSRPVRHYVTSLSLAKATNKDGTAFSQVAPSVVRDLSPAEAAVVDQYATGLGAMLKRAMPTPADLGHGDDAAPF